MPKRSHAISIKRGITKESPYFREFEKFTEGVRKNIRQLREEKGLTQEQMMEFDINLRQFQRIESGETKNITLANLFKIAKALEVKIEMFFGK